jgi:hypothetical protein
MLDWSKQSSVLETDGGSTRAEDFTENKKNPIKMVSREISKEKKIGV